MPSVIFHPAAEMDYQEAFAWYNRRSEQAAQNFENAMTQALDQIAERPEQGIPLGRTHRCRLIKGFPYHVVYRKNREPILIIAIAHGSRRPRYWKNRR